MRDKISHLEARIALLERSSSDRFRPSDPEPDPSWQHTSPNDIDVRGPADRPNATPSELWEEMKNYMVENGLGRVKATPGTVSFYLFYYLDPEQYLDPDQANYYRGRELAEIFARIVRNKRGWTDRGWTARQLGGDKVRVTKTKGRAIYRGERIHVEGEAIFRVTIKNDWITIHKP